MITAAVILNYKDAQTTITAVRRILGYGSIDRIVVVDNASGDGSAECIEESFGAEEKVHLVKAPRNGGYGYGNNLGVRYAAEKLQADLVLIANPDASFEEPLVLAMQKCFAESPDVGVTGAVMKPGYNGCIAAGWRCRSFWGELLHSGPVCKRIFRAMLNYPRSYYEGPQPVPVYAVHGSLLMVSAAAFLKCGGYDEEMFLYMEEYVLGHRMQKLGKRTLLLKIPYRHEGSHSISGAGWKAVARQRMRQESERIYYRRYLGAGPLKMLAARIFQAAVMAETRLAAGLHIQC